MTCYDTVIAKATMKSAWLFLVCLVAAQVFFLSFLFRARTVAEPFSPSSLRKRRWPTEKREQKHFSSRAYILARSLFQRLRREKRKRIQGHEIAAAAAAPFRYRRCCCCCFCMMGSAQWVHRDWQTRIPPCLYGLLCTFVEKASSPWKCVGRSVRTFVRKEEENIEGRACPQKYFRRKNERSALFSFLLHHGRMEH